MRKEEAERKAAWKFLVFGRREGSQKRWGSREVINILHLRAFDDIEQRKLEVGGGIDRIKGDS